jgi:low temperature requirement protein LtrA
MSVDFKIIPKKVQLTELFYDLVFVYAISQATGLIHHVPKNSTFWQQFIIFTVVMIIFINTWMIETVFTNRYGKNSIGNILFFMVDMAILLFMSNNFVGSLNDWFKPFTIAASLLTLTLVFQYLIVYLNAEKMADKQISRLFMIIVGIRAVFLFVGALLPLKIGVVVALIGVFASWVLPGIFTPVMRPRSINFPHLLERLTALIIILFGETIVDIAPYFDLRDFNYFSILIFVIVCALFMTYITQFDHFVDENQSNETGNRMIYLHYPILFGVSLITVSLSFIHEEEINQIFSICLLYVGIVLFYLGLFIADYYDLEVINKELHVKWMFTISTIIGFIISIISQDFSIVVVVTALVTVINSITLSHSMIRQTRTN